ncbi:MAG: serine/threonine-protein kinase [Deltaproteobacteria bacterium]|jgi:serine/threonine protein kinase|nr:serine/threonine-protein kinase [Deltaproteobacteria bacterium]
MADIPDGYEIQSDFGEGSIAKVVKAVEKTTGQEVAIKILKDITDSEDIARLQVEMESISRVRHPNIVSFLNYGNNFNGSPYIVMEWLEGCTLRDILEEKQYVDSLYLVDISLQIAGALAACHKKGVVHRDLKPENVMLTGDNYNQVKLIDFGMAKLLYDGINLTVDGHLFGTPQYLAPERILGDAPTPQTDVYALGIINYEMASGIRPFDGEKSQSILVQHIEEQPKSLLNLMGKENINFDLSILTKTMMRKNPNQRPDINKVLKSLRTLRKTLISNQISKTHTF